MKPEPKKSKKGFQSSAKAEPLKDKKKNRFPSYPNVNFYDGDDIKSACEWLKKNLIPLQYKNQFIKTKKIIDKAFEDVMK